MDRPHPEWAPLGLRFGPLTLKPSIGATTLVTDNERDAANAQGDFAARIEPRLTAREALKDDSVDVTLWARETTHVRFSGDDTLEGGVDANAAIKGGAGLQLDLSATAADRALPRSDPDLPPEARSLPAYADAAFDARLSRTAGRLESSLSLHIDGQDFGTAPLASGGCLDLSGRDGLYIDGEGRGAWRISSAVSGVVRLAADQAERPRVAGVDLSSSGGEVEAGAGFDLSRLARGEITAGYQRRTYASGAPATDGVSLHGRIDWFPTALTTVTLQARRDAGAGDGVGASADAAVGRTEAGDLRIDHELLRNLVLSARYDVARQSFIGLDRRETSEGEGFNARYLMNRRLRWDLDIDRRRFDSRGRDARKSYVEDRAGLTLTLSY